MPRLTQIFRHPIKALGLEELQQVTLCENQTLPGDRLWAVEHEASKFDPGEGWGRCANFIRGASSPQLMAIRIETLNSGLRLTHPTRPDLHVDLEAAPDALIDWVRPICDPDRAQPQSVVRATKQGMTDNSRPWLSVLTAASLDALSEATGTALARERFRGNLWLENTTAWEEFGWVGRRLKLGDAILEITEPIERCKATTVNPDTGVVDADTLGALQSNWDHRNFGVFAQVVDGGAIALGDKLTLL